MNIGKYVELLGQLFEPAYIVDPQMTILFWNKSAEKLTGYEASAVVGKKCDENIMMHINEQGEKLCKTQCPLKKSMLENKGTEMILYLQHQLGHRIPVTTRYIPISNDDGAVIGTIGIFVNNGQTEAPSKPGVIKELIKAAYIDSDTNLPNKEYMENKIKKILADSTEKPYENSLGLLLIEIQNLRDFNNRGGIAAGNMLLKVLAQTLSNIVDQEPGSVVCKWYGGSFIVLMNTNRISTLLNWANKLKTLLEKTKALSYTDENIMVAIGGVAAQPGENFGEVLHRLEEQLQASKHQTNTISVS